MRACALVAVMLAACGGGGAGHPDAVAPDAGPPGIDLGVAYSPKSFPPYDAAQDAAFFTELQSGAWGHVVAFHMDWRDAGQPGGTPPAQAQLAAARAQTYGFKLEIGFGFTNDAGPDLTSTSDPTNNTWTNAETRQLYQQMVVSYAESVHPPYLFLGNEVNIYGNEHPGDWASWLSEYEACYDAVKAVSPQTIVYTTFQLEYLKGAGQKNGWSFAPQWNLVDDVVATGKLDALGFTTYPYFQYETPADIPADYFSEIAAHADGLPVLITETGWTADPAMPFTGSPDEQAAYVARLFELTAPASGIDLRYAAWLELDDFVGVSGAFSEVGLRASDGTSRPADAAWQAAVAAHGAP